MYIFTRGYTQTLLVNRHISDLKSAQVTLTSACEVGTKNPRLILLFWGVVHQKNDLNTSEYTQHTIQIRSKSHPSVRKLHQKVSKKWLNHGIILRIYYKQTKILKNFFQTKIYMFLEKSQRKTGKYYPNPQEKATPVPPARTVPSERWHLAVGNHVHRKQGLVSVGSHGKTCGSP